MIAPYGAHARHLRNRRVVRLPRFELPQQIGLDFRVAGIAGEVHVLAAALKIGNGGAIDNFSNGGMYTMLDEQGRAMHPAADEAARSYAEHPITGVQITGYQVPLYSDALQLVDRLARVVPAMPYIGWDVAITPERAIAIEGNHNTGVFQSKPSVSGIRHGLLAKYRAAMRF